MNRREPARNQEHEQENNRNKPIKRVSGGLNAAARTDQDTTWLVLDNLATLTNAAHRFPLPKGVARRGVPMAPAGQEGFQRGPLAVWREVVPAPAVRQTRQAGSQHWE